MSVNPKTRRKTRLIKESKPSKSKITKKDKIYGILTIIGMVILAFSFYWFVLRDIFYK